MDIKVVNKGKEAELILDGRLDSTAAKSAREPIMALVDRFDTIVLNLEKLEYTASQGLAIIKDLQMELSNKGGELIVKNPSSMIMEIFEMNGFVGFLKFAK